MTPECTQCPHRTQASSCGPVWFPFHNEKNTCPFLCVGALVLALPAFTLSSTPRQGFKRKHFGIASLLNPRQLSVSSV